MQAIFYFPPHNSDENTSPQYSYYDILALIPLVKTLISVIISFIYFIIP